MLAEIEQDVASGTLFASKRFTDAGWAAYPDLLRQAARAGDDATLASALDRDSFWLLREMSQRKGKPYEKDVPYNRHETFAESEFNRFYLRGLCIVAGELGIDEIEVYRAKEVENPRSASQEAIGMRVNAVRLLDDLRQNIGLDTVLRLPPGPNSGLSGKLPS